MQFELCKQLQADSSSQCGVLPFNLTVQTPLKTRYRCVAQVAPDTLEQLAIHDAARHALCAGRLHASC
jgi:hypothetical protein